MKTILISAGHSNQPPKDSGAVGNGFIEAVEAVRLRDETARRLRSFDVKVIEDGADGISDPLKKALVLAKTADIAAEIHFNAAGIKTATGIEVLAKSKHTRLAQVIAKAIGDATGIILRGDKGYKPDNSGQHHRLAFCESGGVIIEVCFISNPSDMKKYSENFDKIAENLANALAEYAGVKKATTATGDPCKVENTEVSYTVQKGDTLFGITKKFSIGLSWLKAKNNLKSDVIEVGQKLIVKD